MTVGNLKRPRSWRIFIPFAVVVLIAVGWSAFWYRAAEVTERSVGAWMEREAAAGRIYTCGARNVGGYPFRIEHRCQDASIELRGFGAPLVFTAKDIVAVAQVYQPRLIIAEVIAPVTIAESGRAVAIADWRLAQASLRGSPSAPERLSVVIEGVRLARSAAPGSEAWALAERMEFHTRIDPELTTQSPVLDFAIRMNGASMPAIPMFATPADADVAAILHGVNDFRPKPMSERLKELQAAGARLEITSARIQQGEAAALAKGSLRLGAEGRLDGALDVTARGFEQFVQSIPGLGDRSRNQAGLLAGLGMAFLGRPAELDGKRAVSIPLRFNNGAVLLGPVPLGRLPPLY